jgi:hypothetical protein
MVIKSIRVFMMCQCNLYVIPKSLGRKDLGSKLPQLQQPGLDTISDDYGQATTSGGWTSPPPPEPA